MVEVRQLEKLTHDLSFDNLMIQKDLEREFCIIKVCEKAIEDLRKEEGDLELEENDQNKTEYFMDVQGNECQSFLDSLHSSIKLLEEKRDVLISQLDSLKKDHQQLCLKFQDRSLKYGLMYSEFETKYEQFENVEANKILANSISSLKEKITGLKNEILSANFECKKIEDFTEEFSKGSHIKPETSWRDFFISIAKSVLLNMKIQDGISNESIKYIKLQQDLKNLKSSRNMRSLEMEEMCTDSVHPEKVDSLWRKSFDLKELKKNLFDKQKKSENIFSKTFEIEKQSIPNLPKCYKFSAKTFKMPELQWNSTPSKEGNKHDMVEVTNEINQIKKLKLDDESNKQSFQFPAIFNYSPPSKLTACNDQNFTNDKSKETQQQNLQYVLGKEVTNGKSKEAQQSLQLAMCTDQDVTSDKCREPMLQFQMFCGQNVTNDKNKDPQQTLQFAKYNNPDVTSGRYKEPQKNQQFAAVCKDQDNTDNKWKEHLQFSLFNSQNVTGAKSKEAQECLQFTMHTDQNVSDEKGKDTQQCPQFTMPDKQIVADGKSRELQKKAFTVGDVPFLIPDSFNKGLSVSSTLKTKPTKLNDENNECVKNEAKIKENNLKNALEENLVENTGIFSFLNAAPSPPSTENSFSNKRDCTVINIKFVHSKFQLDFMMKGSDVGFTLDFKKPSDVNYEEQNDEEGMFNSESALFSFMPSESSIDFTHFEGNSSSPQLWSCDEDNKNESNARTFNFIF